MTQIEVTKEAWLKEARRYGCEIVNSTKEGYAYAHINNRAIGEWVANPMKGEPYGWLNFINYFDVRIQSA